VIGQLPDSAQVSMDSPLGFAGKVQIIGHPLIEIAVEEFGSLGFVVTGHKSTPVKKRDLLEAHRPGIRLSGFFNKKS
jgi:hypothetical protein